MKFSYANGAMPLAGYTIKRGIGVGGFGEVYFALSDGGKEVALKRIQRNLDIELRGVGHCLNLKHPNLVALYDVRRDEHDDSWVVMEYIAGRSLAEEINDHPQGLGEEETRAWFVPLASAVNYLHQRGIVHRDLKPANIFRDEGVVKVGDYGLAKFISCSRRSGQTESVGTCHYMAPEIGQGKYGKEIDIYAMGVILYEMLLGRVPFEGESAQEILMKHLTAAPDLSPLSEPFRRVVARALAKDPAQRYASAAEMATALSQQPEVLFLAGGSGGNNGQPLKRDALASVAAAAIAAPAAAGVVLAGGASPIVAGAEERAIGDPANVAANTVPAADGPIYIADQPPEIQFGRVHDAAALPPLRERLAAWWRDPLESLPVRFEILLGLAAVGFLVPGLGRPLAVVALGYVLFRAATTLWYQSGGRIQPGPTATPAGRTVPVQFLDASAPAGRVVPAHFGAAVMRGAAKPSSESTGVRPLRGWHLARGAGEARIRELWKGKAVGLKASEYLAALLRAVPLAAVASGLLLLTMIQNPDGVGGGDLAALGAWTFTTVFTGAGAVLLAGKLFESHREETLARRALLLAMGLGVGAISFAAGSALLVDWRLLLDPHTPLRFFPGGRGGMAFPVLAGNAPEAAVEWVVFRGLTAYFATSFALLRWWRLADPLRPSRLGFWGTSAALLGCVLSQALVAGPLAGPWTFGVAITVVVQLAASWMKQEDRDLFAAGGQEPSR